jgi:hypothetical protein
VKTALLCLLLTGCASGVQMTDEEAKACRDSSCSAWTLQELEALVNKVGQAAYRKEWSDAVRQGGHEL